MEWKLFNSNGEFLQEVNCQYDALDIATMLYAATEIRVNFENKTALIIN